MYQFYLGKMLLPVAPSKLTMTINNQNRTIQLLDGSQANIPKSAGLTDIAFECTIPNVKGYSFATYENKSNYHKAQWYLERLENHKTSRKPFQFIVIRERADKSLFTTNIKVTLESYNIVESATEGFDLTLSVKLKQYRKFGTTKYKLTKSAEGDTVEAESTKKRSDETAPKPTSEQTYLVKAGDSLWAIAKRFYGDGSKYDTIYKYNKATIDSRNSGQKVAKYTIYPNQQLKIPPM